MRYVLDAEVRVLEGGRVLLGGSPLSFQRLSPEGVAALDRVLAGGTGHPGLIDRLVDRGFLLPVVEPRDVDAVDARDITVVIPVRDRPEALARALRSLGDRGDLAAQGGELRVVVVDDASDDPGAHRAVAERAGATVLRLDRPRGPAGARNAGLAGVRTPIVAFVDSDVEVSRRSLRALAVHLLDPATALVAPRVRQRPGTTVLDRYERAASSIDLGPRPGLIGPRRRVPYVPAAVLVARVADLAEVGGFDADLEVAEDVDLCWRLAAGDRRCRYESSVEAAHAGRTTTRAWLSRRHDYGTGAAALDERHPGAVPPVAVSRWSVAVWAAVASGHPAVAAALAVGSAELLARKLSFLSDPRPVARSLVLRGHAGAGRLLAHAALRPFWPGSLLLASVSRRWRRLLPLVLVVPPAVEWAQRRPGLDPLRWSVLRWLDDLAYSSGVWSGVVRRRRIGPIRPDLSSWPGRRGPRPRDGRPTRPARKVERVLVSPPMSDGDLLEAPLVIEYPFNRTTGPVIGAFLTGLREGVVLGIRGVDGRVVCPPTEYDPTTGEPLTELVEVGAAGVVTSWSWVSQLREGQPIQRPHALALIQLDGADTSMLHVVDCGDPSGLATGDRVRIRWREEREGLITDIECFEPEEAS